MYKVDLCMALLTGSASLGVTKTRVVGYTPLHGHSPVCPALMR